MASIDGNNIKNNLDSGTKYIAANGKEVFLTEEKKRHLLAHPDVFEFLEEAVSKAVIPDGATYFQEAIHLGRTIGVSLLIKTKKIKPDEETDFALRVERDKPVRVFLESDGQPCDSVTLEIKFDEQAKRYFLNTAYIGYPCPYSPYHITDKNNPEYKSALEFWCSHALAYDPKIMEKPFRSSWKSVLDKARE